MQTILYLKANWHIIVAVLFLVGVAAGAYLNWQSFLVGVKGPKDPVGNGIKVGLAKAFDNRSLSLRIERLSNSLAQMKVVDQKATDSVGKVQGQSSTSQTLTLDVNVGTKPAATSAPQKSEPSPPAAKGADKTVETKPDEKPEISVAAGDILNEQLNLATQIMNLQTLYERSITDRLIDDAARLQTVLGFQLSINPPVGFESCAAIVEVAVRMKPPANPAPNTPVGRVSLVAMIPQEKTYNAQSISTNSQSMGGSAVASVVTLGVTSKGEARQLFVHRDSDTVAFERNPTAEPRLFPDNDAAVFGWEFRPVLGRKTVAPGMRQMLAVIALPKADQGEPVCEVEIKTRSYWRRYDSDTQTTARKWHWFPRKIDGSNTVETSIQTLAIPTTAKIQIGLAPTVEKISWVLSGPNRATVIVEGKNFFPGTKVIAAGREHREEDGSLTLKSDQALEFDTTLTAIATGDAVLSGRFGLSSRLELDKHLLPVEGSLYISRATLKQSRRGTDLRISIDVKGVDNNGNDNAFEPKHLEGLPAPVLFIGDEPVPMPYDFITLKPQEEELSDPNQQPFVTADGTVTRGEEFTFARSSTKVSMRVEAWIPSRIVVTRKSSVLFRVPFCGLDYQASCPLGFFEPNVTLLGGAGTNTSFRISHSLWHGRKMTVEVDKIYDRPPQLEKVSKDEADYRLTLPKEILSRYRNLVVRLAGAEPYVIAIPEDKPKPKPVLDLDVKPPEIVKGTIGPAEWSGTDLGLITGAALISLPSPGSTAAPSRTPASFTVYGAGKKIAVYFSDGSTAAIGKAEVEFQVGSIATDTMRAPLLIIKSDLAADA